MKNKNFLKKLWQKKWLILLLIGFFGFLFYLLVNLYIVKSTQDQIFDEIEEVPQAQAVLILGAGVKQDGTLTDVLEDRVIRALELYEAGKVDKILASGDNGQLEYNEVNPIRHYLLDRDVDPEDIFMDHAGFDTYDSMYRSQYIFEVESLIVVTQEFHLPRAVYLGKGLGIETYGYTADRQVYLAANHYAFRESLARLKAFLDLLFNSQPTYLGEQIPITGDGQLSWY